MYCDIFSSFVHFSKWLISVQPFRSCSWMVGSVFHREASDPSNPVAMFFSFLNKHANFPRQTQFSPLKCLVSLQMRQVIKGGGALLNYPLNRLESSPRPTRRIHFEFRWWFIAYNKYINIYLYLYNECLWFFFQAICALKIASVTSR